MDIPAHLRYSTDHEWAAVEGTRVRVGITDYAQDALGDVVFVDLPAVGGGLHRHIAPGGIGDDGLAGVRGDDFLAAGGGTAEVGAEAGRAFF